MKEVFKKIIIILILPIYVYLIINLKINFNELITLPYSKIIMPYWLLYIIGLILLILIVYVEINKEKTNNSF